MRLITDAPIGSPEWHSARKLGIGASEAAAAIGISPWESPHELWAAKTGLVGDRPASLQMESGTALEPLIAKLFERHTGLTLHRSPGVYQSEESPFVLASPDGLIEQDSQAGAEFKCRLRMADSSANHDRNFVARRVRSSSDFCGI